MSSQRPDAPFVELPRTWIAVGILMEWRGVDRLAGRAELRHLTLRSRATIEAAAEVVISAAELGCELTHCDEA
jgi:hypothetical protein